MTYKQVRDMRPEQIERRILGQATHNVPASTHQLPQQKPTQPERVVHMQANLPKTEDLPRKGNTDALLPLSAGMCATLLLLLFFLNIVAPWWSGLQNQWHYGDGRISNFDYNGHHFIGEIYRGYVMVIDIPASHPDKSRISVLQPAPANAVVQFEVRDVNRDGIPDINIGTDASPIAFILYGNKDGLYSKTQENK